MAVYGAHVKKVIQLRRRVVFRSCEGDNGIIPILFDETGNIPQLGRPRMQRLSEQQSPQQDICAIDECFQRGC